MVKAISPIIKNSTQISKVKTLAGKIKKTNNLLPEKPTSTPQSVPVLTGATALALASQITSIEKSKQNTKMSAPVSKAKTPAEKLEELKQDIITQIRTNISSRCNEKSTIFDAYNCILDSQESVKKRLDVFVAVNRQFKKDVLWKDICIDALTVDKENEQNPLFKKILLDTKDSKDEIKARIENDTKRAIENEKLGELKQDAIKKIRTNIVTFCNEESTILDAYSCTEDVYNSLKDDIQKFPALYGKSQKYQPGNIWKDICTEALTIDKENEDNPLLKQLLIDKNESKDKIIENLYNSTRQTVFEMYDTELAHRDLKQLVKGLGKIKIELHNCITLLLSNHLKKRVEIDALTNKIWNSTFQEIDDVTKDLVPLGPIFNILTNIGDAVLQEAMLRDDALKNEKMALEEDKVEDAKTYRERAMLHEKNRNLILKELEKQKEENIQIVEKHLHKPYKNWPDAYRTLFPSQKELNKKIQEMLIAEIEREK